MYNVLIVLIVIAAIFLTIIVVIQESKGGGLASGFAGSNSIMGVRRTTDLIEKTTWGLAIVIVVLSIACAYVIPSQSADIPVVMKQGTTSTLPSVPQATNNAAVPGGATQQQQNQAAQGGTQQGPAPATGQSAPAGN